MAARLIAILILALAGTAGVYAVQNKADDALPCDDAVEVPQIVVTAKRDVAE